MLPSLRVGTCECGRPQIVFDRGCKIFIEPKPWGITVSSGCVREIVQPPIIVLEFFVRREKGDRMPKVSAKEFQRRIAELDTQYSVAEPKRHRTLRRAFAFVTLALIAVAAFSYAHRTSSDFTRLTLKQGTTTPQPIISDAEAQAKWDATWKTVSTGLKGGE